jgi:2-amino-4-hydroxy-6-hydroxymethyldihydropteridine diphosphokinase
MTKTSTTTRISTTRIDGAASPGSVVAFGLGANLGDPAAALRVAVAALARWVHTPRVSSLYRSQAVTPRPQPAFLNAVLVGRSTLSPEALLALAKALELAAGRRRGERHGPRPLDIDLLLYGSRHSARPELRLPHGDLRGRRFVLEPLVEVAPDLPIPPDGATPRELLAALLARGDHQGWLERQETPPWPL